MMLLFEKEKNIMQLRSTNTRLSLLYNILLIAILFLIPCFLIAGKAVCQEYKISGSASQNLGMEALLLLLQQKKMISREEADKLRVLAGQEYDPEVAKRFKNRVKETQMQLDPSVAQEAEQETMTLAQSQATVMEALVLLLQQKGMITGNETNKLLNVVSPEDSGLYVAQMRVDQLGMWDPSKLEKEIEETQENLEESVDGLLQRHRLTERKLAELESTVMDDIAEKQYKTSWAERIKFSGDLRLRFQKDLFDDDNGIVLDPSDPTKILYNNEDRSRYRGRIRLNLIADLINPGEVNLGKVEAGVRVTGGNEDNPVSTNESFGDYFNRDSIFFDLYYLKWQYKPENPIWGRIPQITISGGRISNPWFSSDLLWDEDLNFEGLAINLKTDTLQENKWHAFLTGGVFPLQEVEVNNDDKWLYAGQLGFEVQPNSALNFQLGCAYYYYKNITGKVNDPSKPGYYDYTAPLFQQIGNTLIDIDPSSNIKTALAAEFEIIDVTALLDFSYFFPYHVILEGTYAENIGFDREKVAEITFNPDIEEQNQAYKFGMMVGHPLIIEPGDWNFFYYYKYLEADSVLDAFTDSDFHLGGTNCKGWVAGLKLGLYKNVWLRTRWLTADEIDGPPLAIDVFQFDINARF